MLFLENSVGQLQEKMLEGSLTPSDIANECIERVRATDPEYHAWTCFDSEKLLEAASHLEKRLTRNRFLLPLEGMPVGVKDVFNTADFPTEMGSPIWWGFTPGNDARVVYYLRNAGAVIPGKTVTAEFAVHALNESLNPHDVRVTPGTSSSGSAVAVALGMVPAALGTQTGASIIRPASFCGVYGYKPSFGLLPRTGSLKTTDSLDTIGFFVSHPSDLRRFFEVLRVRGRNFPISDAALSDRERQTRSAGRPWKIGLVKTHTWRHAADYAQRSLLELASALDRRSDIEVSEVELPPEFNESHQIHATIYEKSLAYYFEQEAKNVSEISPIMQNMIQAGSLIANDDYLRALERQEALIRLADDTFREFDVCVSLSTAGSAPLRDKVESPDPSLMWTLAHVPTVSVPIFRSPEGLPFGLQVLGRKYNDFLLLQFLEWLLSEELIPASPTRAPITKRPAA
jgi:Asp-tRNA(Asn)/Glu-tRNA(Gln) amidotransferase A subunit family amidase